MFGNDVDTIIEHLVHDVLADYGEERLHYVVKEFHDLAFPFEPIDAPRFRTDMSWAMEDLLGCFETWSSVKYRQAMGTRPTELIGGKLATIWGEPEQRHDLHFPLYTRIGRV